MAEQKLVGTKACACAYARADSALHQKHLLFGNTWRENLETCHVCMQAAPPTAAAATETSRGLRHPRPLLLLLGSPP